MADFPNFRGTKITVERTAVFSTTVHEDEEAGREASIVWRPAPRVRYSVQIEFLEKSNGDLAAFFNFVNSKAGRLGSFTFNDPYDGIDKLVRFESDEVEAEQFLDDAWEVATVAFITVV